MPLWLTEKDVTTSIDLAGAIAALTRVLAAEADGKAANMAKTHVMVGPNDVHQAIGGSVAAEGLCGTKTWVNVAGKSQTVLVLFSLEDGSLQAMIEATALGQIRTAAMSGVGTDWLAPGDASEMLIVGTGKQALPQIAAVVAVRPIKRVRIYARKAEGRDALAAAARAKFPQIEFATYDDLPRAAKGAQVITLCTNATQPFFTGAMADSGSHINAVGAIVPARAEFTQDVFPRCAAVAVDYLEGVQELSAEFREYHGGGKAPWDRVLPISRVIKSGQRRPANADLTLFKPMGMGIADLAVAIAVMKRCEASGEGILLPERQRQDLPLVTRRAAE
jgi:ornithine cyclodeaminase